MSMNNSTASEDKAATSSNRASLPIDSSGEWVSAPQILGMLNGQAQERNVENPETDRLVIEPPLTTGLEVPPATRGRLPEQLANDLQEDGPPPFSRPAPPKAYTMPNSLQNNPSHIPRSTSFSNYYSAVEGPHPPNQYPAQGFRSYATPSSLPQLQQYGDQFVPYSQFSSPNAERLPPRAASLYQVPPPSQHFVGTNPGPTSSDHPYGTNSQQPFPFAGVPLDYYPTNRVGRELPGRRQKGDAFVARDPFHISASEAECQEPDISNFDDIPTGDEDETPRSPSSPAYEPVDNPIASQLSPRHSTPSPYNYARPYTPHSVPHNTQPTVHPPWASAPPPGVLKPAVPQTQQPLLPSNQQSRPPSQQYPPQGSQQPRPPEHQHTLPPGSQPPIRPGSHTSLPYEHQIPSGRDSTPQLPADADSVHGNVPPQSSSTPHYNPPKITVPHRRTSSTSSFNPYIYVPPQGVHDSYNWGYTHYPHPTPWKRLTNAFKSTFRRESSKHGYVTQPVYGGKHRHSRAQIVIRVLFHTVPSVVYLHLLLRLPSLYFGRVARIFEEADLSLSELKKMALETATASEITRDRSAMQTTFINEVLEDTNAQTPPAYLRLKKTWETFIDSSMREWKTFNIVSVLLLSAILTILQIDAAAQDPVTRYTALLSLLCALISLLFGCMYIIRFGAMRKTYKAAEWALEARKSKTVIWWNVWVLLAMPAAWLAWSLILYIACIMSFVWRTNAASTSPPPDLALSDGATLTIRIVLTAVVGIGIVYGCLIIITFRRYGTAMDKAWKKRIDGWLRVRQSSQNPYAHSHHSAPRYYSAQNVNPQSYYDTSSTHTKKSRPAASFHDEAPYADDESLHSTIPPWRRHPSDGNEGDDPADDLTRMNTFRNTSLPPHFDDDLNIRPETSYGSKVSFYASPQTIPAASSKVSFSSLSSTASTRWLPPARVPLAVPPSPRLPPIVGSPLGSPTPSVASFSAGGVDMAAIRSPPYNFPRQEFDVGDTGSASSSASISAPAHGGRVDTGNTAGTLASSGSYLIAQGRDESIAGRTDGVSSSQVDHATFSNNTGPQNNWTPPHEGSPK